MMKLGVITDGISRDLKVALETMAEHGLDQAELQFVWDKQVGDHDADEVKKIKALLDDHAMQVPCVSRHCFGGLSVGDTEIDSPTYQEHLDGLKRCYDLAAELGSPVVRTMCFRREPIMFGADGADHWNVAKGVWDKAVELCRPIAKLAQERGLPVAVETGNNSIICSAQLGRRMCEELGSPFYKILWDPANALYCGEPATPDGLEALDGILAHVHMKDVVVNPVQSHLRCVELGHGGMSEHLRPLADGLRAMNYEGTVSFESVYRPPELDFADGFSASVKLFKELFSS